MICVILCTYNASQFIEEQLESLRIQTVPIDYVYMHDDCSSDDTVTKINNFIVANKLTNWFIEKNVSNKGWRLNFYDAINACNFRTHDDFVFFCDQDDIWFPEKVETMVRKMRDNPKIYRLNCNFSIDEKCLDTKNKRRVKSKMHKEKVYDNLPGVHWNHNLGCAMCVRGNLLDFVRFFARNNNFAHDLCFVLLSSNFDSGYKLYDELIYHREHLSNASNAIRSVGRIEAIEMEKAVIDYYMDGFRNIDNTSTIIPFLEQAHEFCEKRLTALSKASLKSALKSFGLYWRVGKCKTFAKDLVFILKRKRTI